ncbi:MAG: sodium/glutamate symporter, partial [Victivallaceae bacterium]
MNAVIIFCILSFLLVMGKILRVNVKLFRQLYLPSSVLGGLFGLIIISLWPDLLPTEISNGIKSLPGFLINIVFAALFLGVTTPKFSSIAHLAMPQLCFGQILAWGQYVIGIGLTIVLLTPLFKVNPAFGNLLEIGFEGGHGTVGGMAGFFQSVNWSEGIALGMTVATIGMIIGVVGGMILINWAVRRGYIINKTERDSNAADLKGIFLPDEQPEAGRQTVASYSIDSLAWHVALVGISIALGYAALLLLQHGVGALLTSPDAKRMIGSFPLFPLCMIGGLLLQKFMTMGKFAHLISHEQMQRLSGAALDYLVLSALMTIQLKTVSANFWPLLILVGSGAAWNIFMVVAMGRKIFQEAWFERSIAEFGQSCGVTATGLLLLRTVDPN